MTPKDASVSEDKTGAAEKSAQTGGASASEKATAQSSGDVEAKFAELQRQLNDYQKDINKLKSARDTEKNDYERRLAEQRERYEKQLVALMDDDTRTEYENSTRESRLRELQEKAAQAELALQRQSQTSQVLDTFMQKGVPVEVLMRGFSEGPEGIAGAAWEWLFDRANNPSPQVQQTSSSETSESSEDETPAPKVVTETAGLPYDGPSWDDLVKEHGSEDAVFTAVELGQLPKEVVPEYREAKKNSQ